ncbi:nuclease-related domain-containing protein [Macrococcus epidermidis]|uniref:nuclease-related domain-containing protein n=1 Tax=Macrococcus epidermidis TaxID=1902580 RepID=UPI00147523EA|nr:nuclease-related domain-containing protein [Macrococcus epidermidis]
MERIILEILNSRDVDFDQSKKLEKLRLGNDGEQNVRGIIAQFEEIDAIHDILFEVDGSYFQIDHLIISGNHLIIFDAKYYSTDVYIKNGEWYLDDLQIKNPLTSLNNTVNQHLKKLLYYHGMQLKIYGYIIWCNENAYIYGLEKKLPIIQLNRLEECLQKLSRHRVSMYTAADIFELRSRYNPFLKHYPEKLDTLKKGLNCPKCFSLLGERSRKKYICRSCGESYHLADIVFKNLQYYCLVKGDNAFDNIKFHKFIGEVINKRTLEKYFTKWKQQNSIIYIKKLKYRLNDSYF